MLHFPFYIVTDSFLDVNRNDEPFTGSDRIQFNRGLGAPNNRGSHQNTYSRFIIDYRNPNAARFRNNVHDVPGRVVNGVEVTSTPMPSLVTQRNGSRPTLITLPYKLFGDTYYGQSGRVFRFNITFEQRPSHHLFGGAGEGVNNDTANRGAFDEFPGITEWRDLATKREHWHPDTRNLFTERAHYFQYVDENAVLLPANNLGINNRLWTWR